MIDLKTAEVVEVATGDAGQVWVNTEQGCALRIQRANLLVVRNWQGKLLVICDMRDKEAGKEEEATCKT
jgi:hypothetical protein